MVRKVTAAERRQRMVQRHHLAGDAESPEAVARALVALHATDPASVFLSVLARSASTALRDVAASMYEQRNLVRWMAMRRTLFVFPRDEIPMVQAAISTPLAAVLRRRLVSQLQRRGSGGLSGREGGDVSGWLTDLEHRVTQALERRGTASGAELAADEPELSTVLPARSRAERPQHLTTFLLVLLSADGRIVRSIPTGSWTSRLHRWEPVSHWWPDGLPRVDPARARRDLAHRWLSRFGPATAEDLQWWTGWTKTTTRQVLHDLPVEDVDLHGAPGVDLVSGADDRGGGEDGGAASTAAGEPVATLLPALDPTPMGWKHRDWFFGIDPIHVFDRAGNIGPTLWWDGEIVGSWSVMADGDVRTIVVADRGADADAAIGRAASHLHDRLAGSVVTPAVRTPLEKSLTAAAGSPPPDASGPERAEPAPAILGPSPRRRSPTDEPSPSDA